MAQNILSGGVLLGTRASVEAGALPVESVGLSDLQEALTRGLDDFWAKPSHLLFLGIIYPLAGLVLGRLAIGYEVLPLIFPLIAGFALVGPFVAIGLYEISRRREAGLDTSWSHAFEVLRSPGIGAILGLGFVLLLLFGAWLVVAMLLHGALFGDVAPQSASAFLNEVLGTGRGWALIVIGNILGFLFAVVVLSISVVSFPLIVDRHVSAACAVKTSIAAVRKNPVTMAAWGLIVAVALVIGTVPAFVGLALIVPILGHATWHLYRRVVPRAAA